MQIEETGSQWLARESLNVNLMIGSTGADRLCFASAVDCRLAITRFARVSDNYHSNGCHADHEAVACMVLGHEFPARPTRNGV